MGTRYIIVQRSGDHDWDDAFSVVDTQPGDRGRGEEIVTGVSDAAAKKIAGALNGEPTDHLATAKRALVAIHTFVAAELDKNAPAGTPWESYYTDDDLKTFVARLQSDHEEPF